MTQITVDNYYEDKEYISHSMLRDFVTYSVWGQRIYTPDDFLAIHTMGEKKEFSNDDIIQVGSIVDKYFELGPIEGPELLFKYKAVSRRSGNDEFEITNGMKESIDGMVKRGHNFKAFMEFLKTPGTKSQECLTKEFELTDKDGVVHNFKMKGKPDFINHATKKINDLKTTASRNNLLDEIYFRGKFNIRADYVRQLAVYNFLAGGDYEGGLFILTPINRKYIRIPNKVLLEAWEVIKEDLIEMKNFINNPNIYPDDIVEVETDDLQLI